MDKTTIPLTSSEIAILWTSYMNDSMSKCILTYMLNHLEDDEIIPIIQFALDISSSHLDLLMALFEKEKFAIPNGFNENDVNVNAPKLYSDTFCLKYVNHMSMAGMLAYSGMVSLSSREDILNYFIKGLTETANLNKRATQLMQKKGIWIRSPYIAVPTETDFVDSSKYLSGLNPFSNKRPLNAVEISYLFMNIQTNGMGVKIAISFAQTSPLKEVQDFMLRGKEIAQKHINIFTSTLLDSNIQAPGSPDMCVNNSTTQVFSDKLMMFHISLLSAAGTGNYATSAAASQRSDLALNYERLSLEIAQYAKSGADLMIKHNWLEQPPGTKDKEKLAHKKI